MPLFLLLSCILSVFLAPGQSEPWVQLWQAGERGQAIEQLAKELAGRPDAPLEARIQLVQWQLAAAQFEGALRGAEELPESESGLRGRALYFLARYEECLQYLGEKNPDELRLRVEALKYLGRWDRVLALLPRMRDVFGAQSMEVLLVEARDHQTRREYEAAAQKFLAVRSAHPLEPEALFGLGQCFIRLGRRDEARALLEAHRRLTPLLDALEFAQRGVDIAPSSAPNQASVAEAWQALIEFDPRAAERAQASYEQATRLAKAREHTPIALRFARFHWEFTAKREAALEVLAQALRKVPDPRLHVRRSDYLVQLDRKQEALAQLKQALALRPGDPAIGQRIARLEAQ